MSHEHSDAATTNPAFTILLLLLLLDVILLALYTLATYTINRMPPLRAARLLKLWQVIHTLLFTLNILEVGGVGVAFWAMYGAIKSMRDQCPKTFDVASPNWELCIGLAVLFTMMAILACLGVLRYRTGPFVPGRGEVVARERWWRDVLLMVGTRVLLHLSLLCVLLVVFWRFTWSFPSSSSNDDEYDYVCIPMDGRGPLKQILVKLAIAAWCGVVLCAWGVCGTVLEVGLGAWVGREVGIWIGRRMGRAVGRVGKEIMRVLERVWTWWVERRDGARGRGEEENEIELAIWGA